MADLRGQYGDDEGFFRRRRPADTGVGDWCAPGPADEQKPKWLLMFKDMGCSVFDDEQEARNTFARHEHGGWNCYLFALVLRNTPKVNSGSWGTPGTYSWVVPDGVTSTQTTTVGGDDCTNK